MNKLKQLFLVTILFVTLCATAQGPVLFQAENPTGGVRGTNFALFTSPNATGSPTNNVIGALGASTAFVAYNTSNTIGGSYNLTIRYSNGTGMNQSMTLFYDRPANIGGNGPVTQILFPSTGSWDTFAEITVSGFINAGNARFKIESCREGIMAGDARDFDATNSTAGPRFDWFRLSFVNWTGAADTNYDNPANWYNNEVPPATAIINIPAGLSVYPVLSSSKTIGGAIIGVGATLTISETGTLNVTGSTSTNVVEGNWFAANTNLRVTNTGTVTNNGTIINNGNFILKSTAAGTAHLVGNAVANVTQERLLTSNQRGWRLLSNPLSNSTFTALAAASNITVGNNFTGEHNPVDNTFSMTGASAAFDYNKAYKLFITGRAGESPSYTNGISHVTIVTKGTAANTAPAGIATTANRWYLVANPYTAPVSIARILAASTGLRNSIAYYNPTQGAASPTTKGGGYRASALSAILPKAGKATDVLVPPMGAVFVQAAVDGIINVPTTAIFTGFNLNDASIIRTPPSIFTHKMAQVKATESSRLTIDVIHNGVDYDKLQLRFKDAGSEGNNIDFGKLPNDVLSFYSIDSGIKRSISELELKEQTIQLGITATLKQEFTFSVAENTIPVGFEAVLMDTYTNKSVILELGTTYSFAIDGTTTSQGNDRFVVILRAGSSLSVNANELDSTIKLWPNPAYNEVNITNASIGTKGASIIEISSLNGQLIHSQKSNPGTTTTIQTKSWAKGVYILKATNNGTKTIKKLIIQ